ncbi:ATP-binding protein, partial [Thermodesulfobacteriota bacterium]
SQLELRVEQRTVALLESNKQLQEEIRVRKKAEEQIVRAKEEWERTFDTVPDLIAMIDKQHRIIRCNKAMADRLALTPGEVVGQKCYEVVHGATHPPQYCPHAALILDELAHSAEIEDDRLDGIFHVTASPIRDASEALTGCVHVARDITDRKRAEEALKESEMFLSSIIEQSPFSTWISDRKGTAVKVNLAYRHMLGIEEDEQIVGRYNLFQDEEIIAQGLVPLAKQVLEQGETVGFVIDYDMSRIEHARSSHPDRKTLNVTIFPVKNQKGEVTNAVVQYEDVTEIKRAQELLLQSERLKAIGEMAGGVAHNFNNLLQIVVGGAQLGLTNLALEDISRAKENLGEILETAKWGANTVKRLQDFANIRSEYPMPGGEVFDLSKTVREAIEMSRHWWRTTAEKEGISISLYRKLRKDCLVQGNESELFEVVVNLIKNAVEALPEGGVINVSTEMTGGRVLLTVEDDGIGISREDVAKMFQPFWTTKGFDGAGMGLASSLGIAKRHHGEISVDCAVQQGSKFVVTLPAASRQVTESAYGSQREPAHKCRIVVVDDVEPIARMMAEGLEAFGQEVFAAFSGRECMEILQNNLVDVVLCDLAMPDMNGWQVAEAILRMCKERGLPKIPFALVTGWGGQLREEEKISRCRVDYIVEKPVDIKELLKVIKELTAQ